jgi:hypothetical protein
MLGQRRDSLYNRARLFLELRAGDRKLDHPE